MAATWRRAGNGWMPKLISWVREISMPGQLANTEVSAPMAAMTRANGIGWPRYTARPNSTPDHQIGK